MKDAAFQRWLEQRYPPTVAATRAANVRRVELAMGDLDEAYRRDQLDDVLMKLDYSRADEARGMTDRSGIPINGNVYNGLATLKAATRLYRAFRAERA